MRRTPASSRLRRASARRRAYAPALAFTATGPPDATRWRARVSSSYAKTTRWRCVRPDRGRMPLTGLVVLRTTGKFGLARFALFKRPKRPHEDHALRR